MLLLTIEESNHIMSKTFFIYENKNLILMIMIKSEIIFILMENIEELLIMFAIYIYKAPKEILVVFHNGSTFDFHFIIKELAEEFKGQFECLGKNTEKYITFSVPIKKDQKITYKIEFLSSFRFMSTSLSNLVDNRSDRLHSDKCTDCKS